MGTPVNANPCTRFQNYVRNKAPYAVVIVNTMGHRFADWTGLKDLYDLGVGLKNGYHSNVAHSLKNLACKASVLAGTAAIYYAYRACGSYSQVLQQVNHLKIALDFERDLHRDGPIELNFVIDKCKIKNWTSPTCREILKLSDKKWSKILEKRPDVAAELLWGCQNVKEPACEPVKMKALDSWAAFAPKTDLAELLQRNACIGENTDSSDCSKMMDSLMPIIEEIGCTNFKFMGTTASVCLDSTNEKCENLVLKVFDSEELALSQKDDLSGENEYGKLAEKACRDPDSKLCEAGKERMVKIWAESKNYDFWLKGCEQMKHFKPNSKICNLLLEKVNA